MVQGVEKYSKRKAEVDIKITKNLKEITEQQYAKTPN